MSRLFASLLEREGNQVKISVITRHAVTNYGSLLQAYATQEALERLGQTVEIVDYVRRDEEPINFERTMLASKPNWSKDPFRRLTYTVLRTPGSVISGSLFERERAKLLKMTRRYVSEDDLRNDPPLADVYMVSSDQVWGTVGTGVYDSSYTLSYVPKGSPKISYASSFGKTEIPPSISRHLAKELRTFHRILVREDSAIRLLNDWGLKAAQVLDPTLLLDKRSWLDISCPVPNKGYVLVYQVNSNPMVGRYAKAFAAKAGIPLVRISPLLHQVMREGRFKYLPTMGQFISYINNAALLVTDSFHGTAFAINLNTPFVEVLPENGTSSRNMSLLRLLGLSGRIAHREDDLGIARTPIEYDQVNLRLEHEREASLSLLSEALGE